MGYNVGAIVNRLNYVHKYLEKALDNYKEENSISVQFSIEAVCEALRDWSANNQLSGQVAQNIYAAICREMGQTAENGEIEVGIAGANQRISQADTDDVSVASGELEKYSVKKGVNKKSIALFGGVGALVLLALIGVLFLGNSEKRENAEPDVEIEEQAPTSEDEALSSEENVSTEDTNVSLEDTNASAEDPNTSSEDVNAPSQEAEAIDSQYILPKSDKEKLSRADVEGLSKEQLRLARNEIYARHGMIFGVEDLDQYFATKSWYKPTISFTDFDNKVEMSIVEEQNIILIQQIEKEK
jgi:cytoskeletal protein RodZ